MDCYQDVREFISQLAEQQNVNKEPIRRAYVSPASKYRGAEMSIKVALLPEEWLIQELPRLYRERPGLMHTVLSNILTEDPELRWSLVIRAYQERQINLGKAAELLGLTELELRDRFLELGIPLRLGPADLAKAQSEVAAIRGWYQEVESIRRRSQLTEEQVAALAEEIDHAVWENVRQSVCGGRGPA